LVGISVPSILLFGSSSIVSLPITFVVNAYRPPVSIVIIITVFPTKVCFKPLFVFSPLTFAHSIIDSIRTTSPVVAFHLTIGTVFEAQGFNVIVALTVRTFGVFRVKGFTVIGPAVAFVIVAHILVIAEILAKINQIGINKSVVRGIAVPNYSNS